MLDHCEKSEMFWQTCRFTPTSAFEDVRAIFDALTQAVDDETLDTAMEAFERLDPTLVHVETSQSTPWFLVYVDGDRADLRFAWPDN